MSSIATLKRISASDLSSLLLAQPSSFSSTDPNSKIAIIDVRDDDHIGGHIKNSTHIPSSTLDHQIPSLVRKLANTDTVIFHCALSQQRGPGAALRYLRERERLLGSSNKSSVEGGSGASIGRAMVKNRSGKEEEDGGSKESKDGEWVDVDEEEEGGNREQKVFVLDRGFVGWQEKYGMDERLTEGYRKELWKDGYWM